ncbi:MAG: AGE family epimerase/isomerase [Chloroflexi bacterium]|nr:AGE family epimerase/isomerase [Chloroflexota bacterium]
MGALDQLGAQAFYELVENILPFSIKVVMDRQHGGFYGQVTNEGVVYLQAPKGVVQHSRMLWTFAHAGRAVGDPEYLAVALHARKALLDWFWDAEDGGVFWAVDSQGLPLQTTKLVYGQAFAIYALAEAHLATGDDECLDRAIALYRLLERHSHDPEYGGYWEACHRDWAPAPDLRVDETTLPVAKGMNTHLHMMEAYTNLLRAWNDADLRASLRALVPTILRRILNPDAHQFSLFFDRAWHPLSDRVSYGHDIEGSWLLVEAAEVLGDPDLLAQVQETALQMAYATLEQGVDADGGLFDEGDPSGVTERSKVWWPQAEALVGFLNAYQLNGDPRFLSATLASWRFIQEYLVDQELGEWFWDVDEAGQPQDREKAGFWKTPYYNGRACLEVIKRVQKLTDRAQYG